MNQKKEPIMNNSISISLKSLLTFLVCCLCFIKNINAQVQVVPDNSVGVGTLIPHASAKLEVHSETQGFLMPRMTINQRDAIVSPSDGLEVYVTNNSDAIRGPWYYDGSLNEWIKLALPPGGGTGQVLSINNAGDYVWVTLASDIVTTLVDNGDNTYTYTSEDGTVTVIDTDETTTTLVDNGNDTYTYTSEDGTVTVINTGNGTNVNIYTDDGSLPTNRNVDMNDNILNFDDGRIELNDGANNVLLGDNNGSSITSGSGNAAFGTNILNSNTSGLRNIGIGFNVLTSNTTKGYNVGLGYQVMQNLNANHNIAMGYRSMQLATTGQYNIALGTNSLRSNTTGIHNVAFGSNALVLNTTGRYNFAGIVSSLSKNTSGSHNIGIGYLSLQRNTSGTANVSLGVYALRYNTTGGYNVALGGYSMHQNTTGKYNIGIGQYALRYNKTGHYNVAVGYRAGWAALGSNNVFLGRQAGYSETGSNKLYIENTTSSNPLIYGDFATNYLKINGILHATSHIQDSNGALGVNGQFLGRDAGGVVWQDAPSGGGSDGVAISHSVSGTTNKTLVTARSNGLSPLTVSWTDLDTDTQLNQEQVQDFVGPMLSGNTEIGIQVTYDDGANEIDFINTAPDQVVSLTGTGGAVVTGTYPNFTINAGSSSGGADGVSTGQTVTGTTTKTLTTTRSNGLPNLVETWTDLDTKLTNEQVQDIIGPMVSGNTEIGIDVSYDDNSNEFDFVNTAPDQVVNLNAGPGIIVTGSYPTYTIESNASDTDWVETTSSVYNTTKNIGIGTSSPDDELHVVGRINVNFPNATTNGIAIGDNSGNGSSSAEGNITIGKNAGTTMTSDRNIAIGNSAGSGASESTTTGNVFIGHNAGQSPDAASQIDRFNVYVGFRSGETQKGLSNISIGGNAGYKSINSYNNLIGHYAGAENKGSNLIAIGKEAGEFNEGFQNTFLGYKSGELHTTGNCNTFLGTNTGSSTTNISNSVALGCNAIVNASDKVYLHSNGGTITGDVDYTNPSDQRFKNNVKEDVPGLEFIKRLNPVTYDFDHKKYKSHLVQMMPDSVQSFHLDSLEYNTTKGIGFIAQEVDQILKDLNIEFSGLHKPEVDNPTSHYTIGYSQFVMPLVKAVQEQQAIIEEQNKKIDVHKTELEARDQILDDLIRRIEVLEKE